MTGNALAMAGAFSFILLSIWMAMCLGQIFEDAIEFTSFGFSFPASLLILSVLDVRHAAVSAQSFEARLLTQMVRLPIPSWQDGVVGTPESLLWDWLFLAYPWAAFCLRISHIQSNTKT